MQLVSIYIHIPFCIHRCGYCDFNTYAGIEGLIPSYIQAVCKEIAYLSSSSHDQILVGTIYFGGGTPSLLPIRDLENILSSIQNHFKLDESIEISVEANPGTVSKKYFQDIKSLGINRLSLGMQSSNQNELDLLERQHNYCDVINAVEWTRAAGLKNLNLDLIFGLPEQSVDSWMANLESAVSLNPEHLSLYALTIEPNTPIYRKVKTGIYPEPDQDVVADMYESASERLADVGFVQYEISNWALCNQTGGQYTCKHNIQYWRNLPYLGLGSGAHGFINHQRTINILNPRKYVYSLTHGPERSRSENTFPWTPAVQEINPIDVDTEIGETMMMGLRLTIEGVSATKFKQRYGMSLQERFGSQIDRLLGYDLLEWVGTDTEILRLSKKGRLLGNQVFKEFI